MDKSENVFLESQIVMSPRLAVSQNHCGHTSAAFPIPVRIEYSRRKVESMTPKLAKGVGIPYLANYKATKEFGNRSWTGLDETIRDSTIEVLLPRKIGIVGAGREIVKGNTDSACKNQLVMVSVHYSTFSSNIPTETTTIGKSRVARDSIAMHTSWGSNSEIACVLGESCSWLADLARAVVVVCFGENCLECVSCPVRDLLMRYEDVRSDLCTRDI
ncbi:hypothetical protein F511_14210 [Dorcoceras hygrometricum]|uniref:Uncharacterized protein n=1 Tax=Dorcoceras hygrometricum TaxID=472368 RepID=A0A2Z7CTZ9_9LAMI|nr:hypothetical protein F511_14210 [Dorcoceras hygrometricum]